MKLKEWRFEKYLSEIDMKIIVAKADKRSREQKKTVFFHHRNRLAAEKIENFKKRAVKESIAASPSASLFLSLQLWAKEVASNYMDRNPGVYQLPDPASHGRYSSRRKI